MRVCHFHSHFHDISQLRYAFKVFGVEEQIRSRRAHWDAERSVPDYVGLSALAPATTWEPSQAVGQVQLTGLANVSAPVRAQLPPISISSELRRLEVGGIPTDAASATSSLTIEPPQLIVAGQFRRGLKARLRPLFGNRHHRIWR